MLSHGLGHGHGRNVWDDYDMVIIVKDKNILLSDPVFLLYLDVLFLM